MVGNRFNRFTKGFGQKQTLQQGVRGDYTHQLLSKLPSCTQLYSFFISPITSFSLSNASTGLMVLISKVLNIS